MFGSMEEVRAANAAIGHHWFDAATLEYWGTLVERFPAGDVAPDRALIAGEYFVTSEPDFDGADRRFTVRWVHASGAIETVGGFREHADRSAALAALWPHRAARVGLPATAFTEAASDAAV